MTRSRDTRKTRALTVKPRKYKRYDPIAATRSLSPGLKKRVDLTRQLVKTPLRSKPVKLNSKLFSYNNKVSRRTKRLECKYVRADKVRRSMFFRAKSRGSASARPDHNRKHSRSC